MTTILAIDSSTEACSVALHFDGVEYQRYQHAPRKHAELLLPLIDSLLKEAKIELKELDAIACCVGPGAFTGLRIAVSVAQGIAYAMNIPCIPISSLQALAIKSFKSSNAKYCLAAIDARMNEVYFGAFEREMSDKSTIFADLKGVEQVIAPENIELSILNLNENQQNTILVGSGWDEYQFNQTMEQFKRTPINERFPSAVDMLLLATQLWNDGVKLEPAQLQPIYLRNNVAKKKLSKK